MPNGAPPQSTSLFPTYRKHGSDAELEQGDILSRTPEILRVIGDVHPHYAKADYTHFLVLTQSCDLVRRNAEVKSRYITLAAIRPLDLVVAREIGNYQDDFDRTAKVCSTQHRRFLKQFIERLFNYNEQEYFYLHPETTQGLTEPSCAFLRLSVALNTDHYELCQCARILSLAPLYQAKLGWMVGHLYSRVGTDDWVPTVEPKHDYEKRVKDLLDKNGTWIDSKKLAAAKRTKPLGLLEAGRESIIEHINQAVIQDLSEEVINTVFAHLTKLGIGTEEEQAKKLRARLTNDGVIAKVRKLQSQTLEE